MGIESEHEHWSQKWDQDITAVLRAEDEIQAEINAAVLRGDFHDAAAAALDHIEVSASLNEYDDANGYLGLNLMLLYYASFAVPEHLKPKPDRFPIPSAITTRNNLPNDQDQEPDEVKAKRAKQRQTHVDVAANVITSVVEAEIVAQNEYITKKVKNSALRDAVTAIADYYFLPTRDVPEYNDYGSDQIALLAKKIAEHIEIDTDPTNHMLAFEAYEALMFMALNSPGSTYSSLRVAISGFNELIEIADTQTPEGHNLISKCQQNIEEVRSAQLFKTLYGAIALQPLNFFAAFKPYIKGDNNFGEFYRTRAPQRIRERAKSAYTSQSPVHQIAYRDWNSNPKELSS